MIESLQKEETLLMFSGKEVDFARSLLDKQHKNNPLECWKKSLKHLDKIIVKTFRQSIRAVGQNVRNTVSYPLVL